ncbi:MAG: hypothetical protein ABJA67_00780 [Chthonomonadales bacterium]
MANSVGLAAGYGAAASEGYSQLSSMPKWQPGSKDRRQWLLIIYANRS